MLGGALATSHRCTEYMRPEYLEHVLRGASKNITGGSAGRGVDDEDLTDCPRAPQDRTIFTVAS